MNEKKWLALLVVFAGISGISLLWHDQLPKPEAVEKPETAYLWHEIAFDLPTKPYPTECAEIYWSDEWSVGPKHVEALRQHEPDAIKSFPDVERARQFIRKNWCLK